jgi:hypothetical protein
MYKLEDKLKDLMLETVDFKIDNKILKHGKIKVFNTKQFFIKFKLENNADTKEYEVPYPFRVEKLKDGFLFDYCLSSFIPNTEESYWKMRALNSENASKLHEKYLIIFKHDH